MFSSQQSHSNVALHHNRKAKNSKKREHRLSEEEIKANLRKTVCKQFHFTIWTLSATVSACISQQHNTQSSISNHAFEKEMMI